MASQPPPQRWSAPAVIVALGGFVLGLAGALMSVGGWRGTVDQKLATLDQRMSVAEANQKTYIPVLIGLSGDVKYLAERAHREDDERERGHRR